MLYVTQGPKGVLVVNDDGETQVPTRSVENPVDICGAGDGFSAGAGVALTISQSALDAARMGNLIASITIMKKGTGTASVEEVRARGNGNGLVAVSTLSIDVGGTKLQMAVFDDGGRMVEKAARDTDREGGREWMLAQITEISGAWMKQYRFERCGIGFGGPVHFDEQRIAMSTHVGGWSNFKLTDTLENILGLRPVMDNDANIGALGEVRFYAQAGAIARSSI